jgi:hypothetical protein
MITITTCTESQDDDALDMGVHGKWQKTVHAFSTMLQAFNFVMNLYANDKNVLNAWNKPLFINGFDGDDVVLMLGRPKSLQAYKLATIANMIIRAQKSKGELSSEDISALRTRALAILSDNDHTYEKSITDKKRSL